MHKIFLELKKGPRYWYEEVKKARISAFEVALGYSIGIFITTIALPIANIILILLAIAFLRINKVAAMLGYITLLWPTTPFVYYASLRIGLFIFGINLPVSASEITWEIIKKYFIAFAIGNLLLAGAIATASFLLIYGIWRGIELARWGRKMFLPPNNKAN